MVWRKGGEEAGIQPFRTIAKNVYTSTDAHFWPVAMAEAEAANQIQLALNGRDVYQGPRNNLHKVHVANCF